MQCRPAGQEDRSAQTNAKEQKVVRLRKREGTEAKVWTVIKQSQRNQRNK